jgi:hypothetical protein
MKSFTCLISFLLRTFKVVESMGYIDRELLSKKDVKRFGGRYIVSYFSMSLVEKPRHT